MRFLTYRSSLPGYFDEKEVTGGGRSRKPRLHDELRLTMLLRNHLLGKPRELSVHPLVETPRLDDWKPEGVELIEDKPSSLNSATQPRRVDYVKLKAVLFQ